MPSIAAGGAFYRRLPLHASPEQRDAIYGSVLQSSHVDTEYASMLALSGLIALFGLLQNSQAVIIGAMLISPLMNPILSAALALLLGDGRLGRKSAAVLGVSVGGIILITWMVASLSPLKQATPEILARTNPNLLDLFIAFLSGLAGTLALRSSNASVTIIPGVAIAVAVVPPLSVVGYGLSTGQGAVAGGAFLLFVTNLVSIIISAALVFRLMGFRPHEEAEKGRLNFIYRMGLSAGILLLLSIPLLQTLRKAVNQLRQRAEIAAVMNAAFGTPHSSVSDLSFSETRAGLRVHATLRTTRYLETAQIDDAARLLRAQFGPNARLDVDQILVAQGGISPQEAARLGNAITGGVVQTQPKPAPFDFKLSAATMLAELQNRVDETLAGSGVARLGDVSVELSATPPLTVRARLAAPEPLEAQTVRLLAAQLSTRLSQAVQLHGEVELTGAAYAAALEVPRSHSVLTVTDRAKLAALSKLVAQRPDLELTIRYSPASGQAGGAGTAKSASWPPNLVDIRKLLKASHLPASQWVMEPGSEAAPPPAASGSPKVAATALVDAATPGGPTAPSAASPAAAPAADASADAAHGAGAEAAKGAPAIRIAQQAGNPPPPLVRYWCRAIQRF